MADVGGLTGYILTAKQVEDWIDYNASEYDEYVENKLFDPATRELFAFPDWMVDNDTSTGPFEIDPTGFDFGYNNSHEGKDW